MPRYIDVDKEIREINEVILEKEYAGKADEFTTYCFRRFADALSNAPTADVQEVKHAHWIIIEYEYLNCSNCAGSYFTGAESGEQARKWLDKGYAYSYCPWCGAKMDGKEE